MLGAAGAEGRSSHDADARKTYGLYLLLALRYDERVRDCYGCELEARSAWRRSLIASSAVSALKRHPLSPRARTAVPIGAYALEAFGTAARSLMRGDEAGYEGWTLEAVRFAWPAAQSLGLTRAWFGAVMSSHGCTRWAAALVRDVPPCPP